MFGLGVFSVQRLLGDLTTSTGVRVDSEGFCFEKGGLLLTVVDAENEPRSTEGATQLSHDPDGHPPPRKLADGGQPHGNGRVDVAACGGEDRLVRASIIINR